MRGIIITEPGDAQVLKLTEVPTPEIKDYEILIEVKAAGVNRPDIVQRLGFYPAPEGASTLPGLEVAGIVNKVGSKVTKHKIGDKVCALLTGGGYAQYAAAHQDIALPIPKGLTFQQAASIPETYFTVWSNIFDQCQFKQGETVLIHGGTSGIGVCATQLVKAFGGKVITTSGTDQKCEFSKSIGADCAINHKTQDFVAETLNYTQNKGADIILDMIGGEYVNRNYKAAAKSGRISQIAFMQGNLVQINLNYIMRKKLIHTGSTLRAQSVEFKAKIAERLFAKVWPLFEDKTIEPIIDSVFDLNDVAKAHIHMENSTHKGKIILDLQNY